MIGLSQKPLDPSILTIKGNTHTRILKESAIVSTKPIFKILVQSVVMPTKAPDEVRLPVEPSPADACRQKLKSIIIVLLMNRACQLSKEMG